MIYNADVAAKAAVEQWILRIHSVLLRVKGDLSVKALVTSEGRVSNEATFAMCTIEASSAVDINAHSGRKSASRVGLPWFEVVRVTQSTVQIAAGATEAIRTADSRLHCEPTESTFEVSREVQPCWRRWSAK